MVQTDSCHSHRPKKKMVLDLLFGTYQDVFFFCCCSKLPSQVLFHHNLDVQYDGFSVENFSSRCFTIEYFYLNIVVKMY
ncbi:unnamed protein product [Urochloa humidicola]